MRGSNKRLFTEFFPNLPWTTVEKYIDHIAKDSKNTYNWKTDDQQYKIVPGVGH